MAKRKTITLEEKKLISKHVTGETKRCLAIVKRLAEQHGLRSLSKDIIKEIIEGSPYIEFHPELLKRVEQ